MDILKSFVDLHDSDPKFKIYKSQMGQPFFINVANTDFFLFIFWQYCRSHVSTCGRKFCTQRLNAIKVMQTLLICRRTNSLLQIDEQRRAKINVVMF